MVSSKSLSRFTIPIWIMPSYLFPNFEMLIVLKNCSYGLLVVDFTYSVAWLDVALNLSIRYISTSKNCKVMNKDFILKLGLCERLCDYETNELLTASDLT